MRLLFLAVAAALPLSATSAQAPGPAEREAFDAARIVARAQPDDCPTTVLHHAGDRPIPKGFSKLGDLPPADLALTVMRQVDGCIEPVIVRHDIGGGPPLEPPRR